MQLDVCQRFKQLASSLWMKSLENQLASNLLKLAADLLSSKLEQAMRTHPDIGLMATSLQQTPVTCAFLAG